MELLGRAGQEKLPLVTHQTMKFIFLNPEVFKSNAKLCYLTSKNNSRNSHCQKDAWKESNHEMTHKKKSKKMYVNSVSAYNTRCKKL